MKISLRSSLLAGVVLMAGAAVAQDAPFTVTQDWSVKATVDAANVRFGTGFGGKIYFQDRSVTEIKSIDETGVIQTVVKNSAITGTAISTDDAGNILFNKSFPGAGSGNNFGIYTTEGQIVSLTLTYPDGKAPARMDAMGRVVGNLMSDEGAYFFLTNNGTKNVIMFKVANGQQVKSVVVPAPFNPGVNQNFATTDCANPTMTFAEMEALGDNAVYAASARQRSSKVATYFDEVSASDWSIVTCDAITTTDGFDVFNLGGVDYYILPVGVANSNQFRIVDKEGNAYFTSPWALESGTSYNSIIAHKVDNYTVEIYQCHPASGGTMLAQKYTVKAPAPDVYLVGGFNGWDALNPVTMTFADGVYSYTLPENFTGGFKMSTTKNATKDDWDHGFNVGCFYIQNSEAIADNTGATKYTLTTEDALHAANVDFAYSQGQWTIYINEAMTQLWATNATDKPVIIEPVYLVGGFNDWDPSNPVQMNYADGVYYYTFADGGIGGGFKMSTSKGVDNNDWNGYNAGCFIIADDAKIADATGATKYNLYHGEGAGSAPNVQFEKPDEGVWTIYINENLTQLWARIKTEPQTLYLVGEFNDWTTQDPDYQMEVDDSGLYPVYTLEGTKLFGAFKVVGEAVEDNPWANNWGAFGSTGDENEVCILESNVDVPLCWNSSVNFTTGEYKFYTFKVTLNADPEAWTIKLSAATVTGVEEIAEDAVEAPVYYNIQGVRVNGDALVPGVYVKVAGKKASKVLVK